MRGGPGRPGAGEGPPCRSAGPGLCPGGLVCRQDLGGCAAAGRPLCTHRCSSGAGSLEHAVDSAGPPQEPRTHAACAAWVALVLLLGEGLCAVSERLLGRPTATAAAGRRTTRRQGSRPARPPASWLAPWADETWPPLCGLVYLGAGGARPQPVLLPPPHRCSEH